MSLACLFARGIAISVNKCIVLPSPHPLTKSRDAISLLYVWGVTDTKVSFPGCLWQHWHLPRAYLETKAYAKLPSVFLASSSCLSPKRKYSEQMPNGLFIKNILLLTYYLFSLRLSPTPPQRVNATKVVNLALSFTAVSLVPGTIPSKTSVNICWMN